METTTTAGVGAGAAAVAITTTTSIEDDITFAIIFEKLQQTLNVSFIFSIFFFQKNNNHHVVTLYYIVVIRSGDRTAWTNVYYVNSIYGRMQILLNVDVMLKSRKYKNGQCYTDGKQKWMLHAQRT